MSDIREIIHTARDIDDLYMDNTAAVFEVSQHAIPSLTAAFKLAGAKPADFYFAVAPGGAVLSVRLPYAHVVRDFKLPAEDE